MEHLLRDINDPSVSTLAGQVKHKMTALSGLCERLEEMRRYLQNVLDGKLPVNHQVFIYVFELLSDLAVYFFYQCADCVQHADNIQSITQLERCQYGPIHVC